MTELEYRWAIDEGIPVLSFVMNDDHPWPPKLMESGVGAERLAAFKAGVQSEHTVAALTTPEQLKDDLLVHLPRFEAPPEPEEGADQPVAAALIRPVVAPPEPLVAHPYTLLDARQTAGRARELSILDEWASTGRVDDREANVLALVAIGGMGKTVVAWKWFQDRAADVLSHGAGRLWWSFYETGADFGSFVSSALAYLAGRSVEEVDDQLTPIERESELLRLLDRDRHVIVLDGFERLLLAYSRADFAHLADDDLDDRTDNIVPGARQSPDAEEAGLRGQHKLRKTIDPRVGNFLRRLATVRESRILITTRLFPSELQMITGEPRAGCAPVILRGLEPSDAIALWEGMGVSGTPDDLTELFETFEYYPLLIRALAGKVASDRHAPGDYDDWLRRNPSFDPFSLELVQVRSHVLSHALDGLPPEHGEVLRTIAGSRHPVDFAALEALFVDAGPQLSMGDLDDLLRELEDRGLVGWDRVTNLYDLHPVVRGVVWSGLDTLGQADVYRRLATHFEAIPAPDSKDDEISVAQARPVIELFNAQVGLGNLAAASDLFFERINHKVTFYPEGMVHEVTAMLESLLPDGIQSVPDGVNPPTLAQLGHAYKFVGRLDDALALYEAGARLPESQDSGQYLSFVAGIEATAGRLRNALDRGAAAIARESGTSRKYYVAAHAVHLATAGSEREAMRQLDRLQVDEFFHPDAYRAQVALAAGDPAQAIRHVESVRTSDDEYREEYKSSHTDIEVLAELALGRGLRHQATLRDQLAAARGMFAVEGEIYSRWLLADVLRQGGELEEAENILDDLWEPAERGPYRLHLADASLVQARIHRDRGDVGEARAAAERASAYAECDGPRFTYARAERDAHDLLDELGA